MLLKSNGKPLPSSYLFVSVYMTTLIKKKSPCRHQGKPKRGSLVSEILWWLVLKQFYP
ncbi:hypothetical protein P5673_004287, partial [Acropora cervicornis]